MAWVRLDDGFPEHRKTLQVGGDAAWLHVCALAYCNRAETDGLIPHEALHRLSDRRRPLTLAARLVDVGMWEIHPDGWLIHDYLEYQPSAAKLAEDRDRARERMRNARRSSADVRPNKDRTSLEHPTQFAERSPNPVPSRPVPIVNGCTESSRRLTAVHPAGRDDLEQVLALVADARVDGARNVRSRRAYRTAVLAEARLQDGELARSLLADGSTIEQTAMYILGHGIGAEAEHGVTPDAWCDPDCPECHGDHWIDDGTDRPAPCPNGPRAAKATS